MGSLFSGNKKVVSIGPLYHFITSWPRLNYADSTPLLRVYFLKKEQLLSDQQPLTRPFPFPAQITFEHLSQLRLPSSRYVCKGINFTQNCYEVAKSPFIVDVQLSSFFLVCQPIRDQTVKKRSRLFQHNKVRKGVDYLLLINI